MSGAPRYQAKTTQIYCFCAATVLMGLRASRAGILIVFTLHVEPTRMACSSLAGASRSRVTCARGEWHEFQRPAGFARLARRRGEPVGVPPAAGFWNDQQGPD